MTSGLRLMAADVGMSGEQAMKQWMCLNCGWIYDQDKGDPDSGLAPGTSWEDVPDDWKCPDCGSGKADFELVEI